ncbi:MAG: IS1634 family transposase [Firmicutes bacterium]|nr:IS1634 family transposase [Bacillota bacterium]
MEIKTVCRKDVDMYLKKTKKPNGRLYLSIVEGRRDKETKNSRTVTIQKVGYLDDLEKKYPDPIAHFNLITKEMNRDKAEEKAALTITIDSTQRVGENERKNFGYVALSAIYHELKIHKFLTARQRTAGPEYNLNQIMRLLVFSRLLYPGSKKKAYENRQRFFERSDFNQTDMYRALSKIANYKEALQLWMHERVIELYGRDTSVVYYDVTNYYFEIDEQDKLRRKGISKEHRPDPIVQMGLMLDNNGVPIAYQLFPGNANDCTTLLPIIKRIRRQFGTGKAIVVSDKGLNTGKNAYYLANSRGGYVFSQTVRGGNADLKKYVLDATGYDRLEAGFKKKSRQHTRLVEFEDDDGKDVKANIAEKQVVFYSPEYDRRAKADRASAVRKARAIINNPQNFNKKNSYGAAKYIRQIEYDKNTGEIITPRNELVFNEEALAEDEKFDGYYVIVTSRHFESDDWVIDTYRGLWRIEETFKVTKSDLEARPVFVSRQDRIEAHFLICFVALLIIRLLQRNLKNVFSVEKILDSLAKSCCSLVKDNVHMFDYYDEVLTEVGSLLGIDFSLKYRTQADIKNVVAGVKIF